MYDSDADYLLFYSEKSWMNFLQRGILIRDCSNFQGLQRGYYRIAVKSEEQNRIFAEVLREIHGNAQAVECIDRMKEKSEERIDRVKEDSKEQSDRAKGRSAPIKLEQQPNWYTKQAQ